MVKAIIFIVVVDDGSTIIHLPIFCFIMVGWRFVSHVCTTLLGRPFKKKMCTTVREANSIMSMFMYFIAFLRDGWICFGRGRVFCRFPWAAAKCRVIKGEKKLQVPSQVEQKSNFNGYCWLFKSVLLFV